MCLIVFIIIYFCKKKKRKKKVIELLEEDYIVDYNTNEDILNDEGSQNEGIN